MQRRAFVAGMAAVLTSPLRGGAQQARTHPRVGVLMGALPEGGPHAEALREGLRAHGYIEGQNIAIEWRWAHGDLRRLAVFAEELVRLKVDVIVANSNVPIRAARNATGTIPIVMVYSLNPVTAGFAASLARPGGNITGLTLEFPELHGKRLQLLKEMLPALSRVALVWDADLPEGEQRVKDAEAAAPALGLRLQRVAVRSPGELEAAFAAMTQDRAGAAYYMGSTMLYAQRDRAAELAVKRRLPLLCSSRDYVESGCAIAYSASFTDLFQRASAYVDKILKGANPGDLPIQQPTKFDLVINMKTVKALGLTIPPSLLLRAEHVIE
jgi:putative ABC transport system substrate-binding protein